MDYEESPCQGKCYLNLNKCNGCHRTKDEIADWNILDLQEKTKIWKRIMALGIKSWNNNDE